MGAIAAEEEQEDLARENDGGHPYLNLPSEQKFHRNYKRFVSLLITYLPKISVYNNPQPRKKSYKSVPTHGICFDKDTLVDLASDGKEKMYSDGVKIGNWFEDRKKICQKNWYCDQNVDLSTRDVTPSSHVDYKKHKCVGYGKPIKCFHVFFPPMRNVMNYNFRILNSRSRVPRNLYQAAFSFQASRKPI